MPAGSITRGYMMMMNMERVVKLGICAMLMMVPAMSRAQISTPCTASMVTSFTPCINLVTGSSSNGTSPTASCCGALKELVAASIDCACLLLTANVPIQLPFGGPLSIPLPRPCKMAVPLRCKASGSPLPAPGPAILGPSAPPSPSSPQASAAESAPAPDSTVTLPLSPAISPEADNPTGGTQPLINTSTSVLSHDVSKAASLLIAMMILLVTYYCF